MTVLFGEAAFKHIIAVLTLYNNGIAAIGGLTCLAKAAQE
jgi:hypothetical protein